MKISVIIPFYNCESFIREVAMDLQAQTMKDYEVIFVDDASSDASAAIVKAAVKNDVRFRYLRNEKREGAAFSRNRGIKESHAPYILCLDADDRYEADLLEQLTEAAYKNEADLVMLERNDFYDFDVEKIERERHCFQDEAQLYKKGVFSVSEQPIEFLIRCENATYDRLVRKEILDKYDIRFQDLKNTNDVYYIVMTTFLAERIVHTESRDSLYHRRVHAQPQRISNDRDPMCTFEALYAVHDGLIEHDLWDKYCVYFMIFALDLIERHLFCCKDINRQKLVYEYIVQKGLKQLGIGVDNNYNRLPQAYRKQYTSFMEKKCENERFLKSLTLKALCELNAVRIKKFAEKTKEENIVFWGLGRNTEVFLHFYESQNGKIAYIVDNDKRKQGMCINDVPVVAFEDIWDSVDGVIISNEIYYNSICRQIRKKKELSKIWTLNEILYCDDLV